MRWRGALVGGCLVLGPAAWMWSCSEPPETSFGNPNTLDRKNLPGEGGVEALVCSDAGGEGGSGDGGCPSFATDIYPYFTAGGAWRCADRTCHGGASPPNIDAGSPGACYAALKQINVQNKPYLPAAGSTDPNASTLLCNLQGTCGSKMPKPPGTDPTTADLCKVEAWIKCGAPNN